MKKILCTLVICFLFLFVVTGCGVDKEDDSNDHYKPAEYKHTIAIDKAKKVLEETNEDMKKIDYNGPANTIIQTFRNNITKLNEHLVTLESTQKQLSDDTSLSSREVRIWNNSYSGTIKSIKNEIKHLKSAEEHFINK